MAQPPAYIPVHSFVSDSATLANFPGQALDVEFQDVKTVTDAIRTNLALIQRDDGALANGAVGYDALSPSLQTAGLAPANGWATATAYAVGNSVINAGTLYRCLVAHTSGVFATDLAAGKWLLVATLPSLVIPFTQPTSYPVSVTYGHVNPFLDSDAQFGNAWSQYPLSSVSTNPLIIGKAGSSIGSSAPGQIFKIVFTSAGLSGSPITKSYTAAGGDTVTTIAAGLAALVNADPVLHGTGGKPIFMQPLGGGVFNLQYDSAFSVSGATPLTTTTTGSTGTITLASEVDALDFIVMQLGRNATGHTGKAGDALYALDFTGQDSTGAFNTHYAQITVTATVATAGATRGTINFTTANNSGLYGRVAIKEGLCLFDNVGVLPLGGDRGPGTINIPAVGKYSIDNVNNIRNAGGQFIFEATNTDHLVFSTSGGGIGFNATPTGTTFTCGLGAFFSGVQVPTTGSGISLAGGATPVLSAKNYGTATRLPLAIDTSALTVVTAAGTLTVPAVADTLVGKATTDILTNKTFDTAATGNVFKINGVTITANTGIGSNVLGTAPTISQPNLVGTTTNDNAAAGSVGELISATVLVGSAVSLTNGTPTNITSISLTAGDWDVAANACFHPAGTTTWTSAQAWTSTTSAATPTAPNNGAYAQIGAPMTTGADQFLTVGAQRISLASTTTVFLSALAGFGTSTMQGYGFIRARRVR